MNTKTRFSQLWDYFKIQDDELLIVRSYNATCDADRFIVARKVNDELELISIDTLPDLNDSDIPFRLVQHRSKEGRYIVPSVEQLKLDELMDY